MLLFFLLFFVPVVAASAVVDLRHDGFGNKKRKGGRAQGCPPKALGGSTCNGRLPCCCSLVGFCCCRYFGTSGFVGFAPLMFGRFFGLRIPFALFKGLCFFALFRQNNLCSAPRAGFHSMVNDAPTCFLQCLCSAARWQSWWLRLVVLFFFVTKPQKKNKTTKATEPKKPTKTISQTREESRKNHKKEQKPTKPKTPKKPQKPICQEAKRPNHSSDNIRAFTRPLCLHVSSSQRPEAKKPKKKQVKPTNPNADTFVEGERQYLSDFLPDIVT